MRLLIFGDSFAASTGPNTWPNMLAQLLKVPMQSYAEGASSLFFTYRKLLEADIKPDDIVVVVVTSKGRIYRESSPQFPNLASALVLAQRCDPEDAAVWQAAIAYYTHIQNDVFDEYVHNSIIKDTVQYLEDKSVNYLLLPGFDTVPCGRTVDFPSFSDVVHLQNSGRSPHECDTKYNLTNHLTVANQIIFAKALNRCLSGTSVQLSVSNFATIEAGIA